jgi:hypothetical protein
MAKIRVFVTLDENNVRWLRARSATDRRGLSDTVDALITTVRRNGQPTPSMRSVVGTITRPAADPADLTGADAAVRAWVSASLARTSTVVTRRSERSMRRAPRTPQPERFRPSAGRHARKPRRG